MTRNEARQLLDSMLPPVKVAGINANGIGIFGGNCGRERKHLIEFDELLSMQSYIR